MFFRRETPHVPSFAERIEGLKTLGLTTTFLDSRHAQVSREGIGAVVEDVPGKPPQVNKTGLLIGEEIGLLVNGGYQMFWKTPTGNRVPAQASQLTSLHKFGEDLSEGLGLISLYNEGLGTVSDLHLYDRVEHRDESAPHKPWEVKISGV